MGGRWGLLWMCVVLCFKTCKEAVEVVEQRDVAVAELWRRFIVCDGLNALPQAPCVSAVFKMAGYLVCVFLLCFPDAVGQVGSGCSQASFIPGSEGIVSGPQQPMDILCQPWLLVSLGDDGFCVGHIINASYSLYSLEGQFQNIQEGPL